MMKSDHWSRALQMDHWSRALRRWLRHRDLLMGLVLLSVVLLLFAFLELVDSVTEGETQQVDQRVLLALRIGPADAVGPPWFEQAMIQLTALGGVVVVTLVTLIVIGYLATLRAWRTIAVFTIAIIGAALSTALLKVAFDRPRPTMVEHLVEAAGLSFPSGHSLLAAVVYPTLGALLTRVVQPNAPRLYVLSISLLLMILIGCSRVYLGVHYPSDVLAGWLLGLAWALTCWAGLQWLHRRRIVPPEEAT